MSERPDLEFYSSGFCYGSVCVPAEWTPDQVVEAANKLNPTGIDSPWALSSEPTFKGGQPNPCPCHQSKGRSHWLLCC